MSRKATEGKHRSRTYDHRDVSPTNIPRFVQTKLEVQRSIEKQPRCHFALTLSYTIIFAGSRAGSEDPNKERNSKETLIFLLRTSDRLEPDVKTMRISESKEPKATTAALYTPQPKSLEPNVDGLWTSQPKPPSTVKYHDIPKILKQHYRIMFDEIGIRASDRYMEHFVKDGIEKAKKDWAERSDTKGEPEPHDVLAYHGVAC